VSSSNPSSFRRAWTSPALQTGVAAEVGPAVLAAGDAVAAGERRATTPLRRRTGSGGRRRADHERGAVVLGRPRGGGCGGDGPTMGGYGRDGPTAGEERRSRASHVHSLRTGRGRAAAKAAASCRSAIPAAARGQAVVDRDEGKKNENVGGGLRGDEGVAEKEAQGAAPFGGRSGGGMMRSPPGLLAMPHPSSAAGASGESRGPPGEASPPAPSPYAPSWSKKDPESRYFRGAIVGTVRTDCDRQLQIEWTVKFLLSWPSP